MLERLVVAFSIFIVVFAIGYAGSAAVTAKRPARTPAIALPLAPDVLVKKIEKLEVRLAEAQTSIDEVLKKLASVNADSERDATRVRLDVLYRLETGLVSDIARTRDELQSRQIGRVDPAWQSLENKNR